MVTETTDIKGFEGLYTIDTFGKIYSLRKKRYLKPTINNSGYVYAYLTDAEGYGKWYGVHRLVLLSFGFKPNEDVNHKDGNKLNNYIGNLEFVTHAENIKHSYTRKRGCGRKPGFTIDEATKKKMSKAKQKPIVSIKDGVPTRHKSIAHAVKDLGIYRKAIQRSLSSGLPYQEIEFKYA